MLILWLICINNVSAQEYNNLHNKYFSYKNRLQYFVVFGEGSGHALLSSLRNRDAWIDKDGLDNSGDEFSTHCSITFGQSFTRSGYLLATLTLEYKLLLLAGDTSSAKKTLQQINNIIAAFNRCDLCESGPPWFNAKDTLDGFFVREDFLPILSDTMYKVLNKNLDVQHSLANRIKNKEYGVPGYIEQHKVECLSMYTNRNGFYYKWRFNPHPDSTSFNNKDAAFKQFYSEQKFTSQDEVIGALIGLYMVVELIEDKETMLEAAETALRMIQFLSGYSLNRKTKWWRPRFPNGTLIGNNNGGDIRAFAFPLKIIAKKIIAKTNLKNQFQGIQSAPYFPSYFEGAEISSISNIGYKSYRILSFLTCETLSMSGESRYFNNVSKEIAYISRKYNWDTFYLLLHGVLNKKNEKDLADFYNYKKLYHQLNTAPKNGPYFYLFGNVSPIKEWSAEFKWSATIEAQNGLSGEKWVAGNFSGIDYMILHNLACLMLKEYRDSFLDYYKKNNL